MAARKPVRTATSLDKIFQTSFPSAHAWVRRLLSNAIPRGYRTGSILEGESAYLFLISFRENTIQAASATASSIPEESWLILIRKLDPRSIITSGIRGEDGDVTSLLRIAENLAGLAKTDAAGRADPDTHPDRNQSVKLARLIAFAEVIDDLEGKIRSATKGIQFRLEGQGWPSAVGPIALQRALMEFDSRGRWLMLERWEEPLTPDTNTHSAEFPPILMAYRYRNGFEYDSDWSAILPEKRLERAFRQFSLKVFVAAHPSHVVLSATVMAAMTAPEQAAALVILGNTMLRALKKGSITNSELLSRGTLTIAAESLRAEITDTLRERTVAAWLSANAVELTANSVLDHMQALTQPGRQSFPGSILLKAGDQYIVDAAAATWHVSVGLRLDPRRGGELVNGPAFDFEATAQRLVNESSAKPPASLIRLRGRSLSLNGRSITDIDTIALHGTQLFLISCKRYVPDLAYFRGDYKAARNGQSKVTAALNDWEDKLEVFRQNPRGDNYDFSGYRIEGFILMPELLFTEDSRSREMIDLLDSTCFFTRVESIDQFAATLEMLDGRDGAGLTRVADLDK